MATAGSSVQELAHRLGRSVSMRAEELGLLQPEDIVDAERGRTAGTLTCTRYIDMYTAKGVSVSEDQTSGARHW